VLDKDKSFYNNVLKQLNYDEHYWIPLQTQNGYNENGLDGVVGEDDKKYSQIPCWSLFKGLYIDVDLNVRTCCYGHDDCFILGNLKTAALPDILKSAKYREMKEKHLNNNIPNECKKCLRSM
jgi:radical SAM protein with 4Fe4S-binding SPASM domain